MGKYFRFLHTSFCNKGYAAQHICHFWHCDNFMETIHKLSYSFLSVNRQNFDSTVNLTKDYDTVLNFEGTSWFLPFTMPGAENLPKQHCHFDSLHGSLQDQMNFKDRSQIPLPELLIYQKWLIRPGQSTQALGDQWGVLKPGPQ